MEFCLKRNTVCINIIDQPNKQLVKRLIFFGDIPGKIRKIINSRKFNENANELTEYFGKRWKQKLRLEHNTKSIKMAKLENKNKAKKNINKTVHQGKAQSSIRSAKAIQFEGAFEDKIEGAFEFDLENATELQIDENTDKLKDVDYDEKITYITNIILFPEDTFWTLKEKIYLATNIPVYRQYIYQPIDNNSSLQKSGHTIYISDSVYNIDTNQDTELFNGILVDKNIYNNRENLRIKTKEPYKMIDSMLVDDIYLIDLQFYKNALTGIESILNSNYSSDVLFYGLFRKYYPIFNKEMMVKYFTDENLVLNEYPIINVNRATLEDKYETEKDILLDVYNNTDDYFNRYADDVELSISEITYKLLDSYTIQNSIFIRNLVDLLPCDENFPFIDCYNTKNNVKYRIVRYYKNQSESQIKSIIDNKNYKIIDEVSIHFWDHKYKQLNIFTINANATYTVTFKYQRSDGVDFSDSLENVASYVNKFLEIINNNKRLLFNPNFTFAKIPDFSKETTLVSNVRVNVKWNSIVTQQQFAQVSESLQKFYKAGIAEHRVLSTITPNVINIRMKKGITQKVNKFYLKKRVEVKDYYIIYHEIKSYDIWNIRYGGKNINIENNLTDITFEFVNIADNEFVRVINYILYIINDVAKNKSNKEIISKTNMENSKKSAMKKMKALDPKLYNFSVSGSTKIVKYSRICQKKFRPINIYTKEEFNLLPADHQKRLFQFINYTTGEPVWYECPKSLPILGFITNKHPAGYCIPKCKLSDTKGTKNQQIREACISKHSFEKKTDTTGILKFGKVLQPGKVGFLHEKIYELFSVITNDNSAHLFIKSVSNSYKGIPGSKLLCCFAEQIGKPEYEILDTFLKTLNEMRDKDETLISAITDMINGNPIIEDMNNSIEKLIIQAYNVHIVYINTHISIQNEILNSQNSSISFSMDSSCSAYLSSKQNIKIILIQRLHDNIYPILYTENKLNKSVNQGYAAKERKVRQTDNIEVIVGNYTGIFDNESVVVDTLSKAINRKLIKTEHEIVNKPFTYYALKDKLEGMKYVKYISNGNIKYIVTATAGKSGICIGVSNSINITDGDESHDVFVRGNFDLPFAKLVAFLQKFKSIHPTIIVLNAEASGINEVSDSDIAIGLRISNINCWFNDTPVKKVLEVYPDAPFQIMVVEPSSVNMSIAKRSEPKKKYMKSINNVYYEIYIYKILKFELYKFILLERDRELRSRIMKNINSGQFIDELSAIKYENRDDYHKILNIINNSKNVNADLNKILLNHDIKYIINKYTNMSDDKLLRRIGKIIDIISISTNEISGELKNIIVSYIEYGSESILSNKHAEDLFYRNNRVKLQKNLRDIYIKQLFDDLRNKLVFTYEINDFNIFFIINYLQFTQIPGTNIHIQFL